MFHTQKSKKSGRVKRVLGSWRNVVVATVASASMVAAALANAADEKLLFDIAPQLIVDALAKFSEQSGLHVSYVYSPRGNASITSGRVVRSYTSREAL